LEINEILISLVRSEILGEEPSAETVDSLNGETMAELYKLSKPQDITHIVANALLSRGLVPDGELKNAFLKEQMTSVFRHAQIRHELDRVCRALDAAKIDHMPLKGSVIRRFYPRPELRTSCDIDVLVKPSMLDVACGVMVDVLKYKFEARTAHDVSYYSPSKTHIELHYDLFESDDAELNAVISRTWDMSHTVDGSDYRYEMENDMFVVYHIAHMAKHFMGGGCGVRPFIDLWIAKNKMGYNKENVISMLSECSLGVFAEQVILLSDIWLGGESHTELTREMENYILGSAIYGTVENHVAIEKAKKGGSFGYYFSRLFMPYSKLKKIYPRLEKYPILYPFYQVKRWCRFIYRGRLFHARAEIKAASNTPTDKQKSIVALCDSLGLK